MDGLWVFTNASFPVRGQLVARIADAFEGSVHVDALSVITHARLAAFVHVHAERTHCRAGKSFLADALIRAGDVLAATVQADPRVLQTFVHI